MNCKDCINYSSCSLRRQKEEALGLKENIDYFCEDFQADIIEEDILRANILDEQKEARADLISKYNFDDIDGRKQLVGG